MTLLPHPPEHPSAPCRIQQHYRGVGCALISSIKQEMAAWSVEISYVVA